MIILTTELVDAIHDSVLNAGELRGKAGDKSLDAALARVDNRLAYGLINDVFDLAAAYAAAISQGHCFNDGNKRTAFRAMFAVLRLNGVLTAFEMDNIGPAIVTLAQRKMDETDFALWLRNTAGV